MCGLVTQWKPHIQKSGDFHLFSFFFFLSYFWQLKTSKISLFFGCLIFNFAFWQYIASQCFKMFFKKRPVWLPREVRKIYYLGSNWAGLKKPNKKRGKINEQELKLGSLVVVVIALFCCACTYITPPPPHCLPACPLSADQWRLKERDDGPRHCWCPNECARALLFFFFFFLSSSLLRKWSLRTEVEWQWERQRSRLESNKRHCVLGKSLFVSLCFCSCCRSVNAWGCYCCFLSEVFALPACLLPYLRCSSCVAVEVL